MGHATDSLLLITTAPPVTQTPMSEESEERGMWEGGFLDVLELGGGADSASPALLLRNLQASIPKSVSLAGLSARIWFAYI